jgi:predicted metal-dependent hydrolase
MERSLDLSGKKISYTLKSSARAKYLRLAVHRGGILVAVAPARISVDAIEGFILKKSNWVIDSIERLSAFAPQIKTTKADYLKHREAARRLVHEKILKLNQIYKFKVGRVAIKDQKTRWGSCSSKGNLNFNYRIALLPDHLSEYIVAHELCHLGELNHSARFWALVEKTVPLYRQARKELEKSGISLR